MKNNNNKAVPNDEEIEKALIGAMLSEPKKVEDILLSIELERFYSPIYKKVVEIIYNMAGEGEDINLMSFKNKVESVGLLNELGGLSGIANLCEWNFENSHWQKHSNILQALYKKREIIKEARRMEANAFKSDNVDEDIMNSFESINRVLMEGESKSTDVENNIELLNSYIELNKKKSGELIGMSWGKELGWLDKFTGGVRKGKTYRIGAPSGLGKAQRLTDKVLTLKGWSTMGEMKVGDKVVGADGKPKQILAIPYKGTQEVYKITTTDKRTCYAGLHHEFRVKWRTRDRSFEKDLEVKDLIEGMDKFKLKFRLDLVKPIEYEKKHLSVAPYVLGAMLGDGYIKQSKITSADPEIIANISERLPEGDIIERQNSPSMKDKTPTYIIKRKVFNGHKTTTMQQFQELNLFDKKSNNKFIPTPYLFSSLEDRVELLQGLMDTDGYVVKNKNRPSTRYGYTSISKELAENIKELIMSLGGKVSLHIGKATLNGRVISDKYVLDFSLPPEIIGFKLKRKAENIKNVNLPVLNHFIEKIEFVEVAQTQCITVEDSLYITKDYIVTHNTNLIYQLIVSLLEQGQKVLFCSLENNIETTYLKLLSTVQGVNPHQIEKGLVEPNLEWLRRYKDKFVLTDQLFDMNEIKREALKTKPDVLILDYIGLVNMKGYDEKTIYNKYADEVKEFVQKHQWLAWIDLSNLNKSDDEQAIRFHKGFNGAAKLRNNVDVAIHMFDYAPFADYKKIAYEENNEGVQNELRSKKVVTFFISKNRLGNDNEEQQFLINFNNGIKYVEASEKQKELWNTLI